MKLFLILVLFFAYCSILFFSLEAKVNMEFAKDAANQANFDEMCLLANGKISVVDRVRICAIADKIMVHR